MESPEGDDSYKKKYWKLNKAFHGLKQTVCACNNTFNRMIIEFNFIRLRREPCIYIKENREGKIIRLLAGR